MNNRYLRHWETKQPIRFILTTFNEMAPSVGNDIIFRAALVSWITLWQKTYRLVYCMGFWFSDFRHLVVGRCTIMFCQFPHLDLERCTLQLQMSTDRHIYFNGQCLPAVWKHARTFWFLYGTIKTSKASGRRKWLKGLWTEW